jgi:hypothetical protein
MSCVDLAAQRERSRSSMAFERRAQRNDYLPRSVGHAASLALGEAIIGWIAGLEENEVLPIVERARLWLEDSVERGEEFGVPPSYFAVLRMEALAVACWILGEASEPRFAATLPLHTQAFADLRKDGTLSEEETFREDYLPEYVRDCACAREYELGVEAYAHHGGRPLADEDDVATPLELAAWVCQRRAGGADDPPLREQTAARILRAPLVEWVRSGQGVAAAAWLKLAFCDAGTAQGPAEAFPKARELIECT